MFVSEIFYCENWTKNNIRVWGGGFDLTGQHWWEGAADWSITDTRAALMKGGCWLEQNWQNLISNIRALSNLIQMYCSSVPHSLTCPPPPPLHTHTHTLTIKGAGHFDHQVKGQIRWIDACTHLQTDRWMHLWQPGLSHLVWQSATIAVVYKSITSK